MIDENGYRHNVGIIIVNKSGELFWGQGINHSFWQFPQGGVNENETAHQAAFRELKEEVGLEPKHVRIIGRTKDWIYYDLPEKFIRRDNNVLCIGQKQQWFMFGLESDDNKIDLNSHKTPEFEEWRWVDYWLPVKDVINFKKNVYQTVLAELEDSMHKFWLNTKACS